MPAAQLNRLDVLDVPNADHGHGSVIPPLTMKDGLVDSLLSRKELLLQRADLPMGAACALGFFNAVIAHMYPPDKSKKEKSPRFRKPLPLAEVRISAFR